MNKIWHLEVGGLLLWGTLACSDGDSTPEPSTSNPTAFGEAGLRWEDGTLTFRTEPFSVSPGEESYLCWAVTVEEDLKVGAFDFAGAPVVHHFMLSQTVAPEPDGWSVCEDLLKPTWRPIFTAGAGANALKLPGGVAHDIKAGTQLVVQLHLVNTGVEKVTDVAEIEMGVTADAQTEAVQIGGFGSFQISLPPAQKSSIVSECTLPTTSRLVALMPHMHQMGTSMTLELGTSKDDLQVIYARDPWDFDQQTIDTLDTTLEGGRFARLTCNYDNPTDRTITYGESSFDEMCFLGIFWVGEPTNCVIF
jgi:hypothetical protein